MTTASNRLYRGELNNNPLGALEAIVDELNYEADMADRPHYGIPPDESDREFAARLRVDAKKVRKAKQMVSAAVSVALEKVYAEMAEKIREEQIAGDFNNEIADALESGCWESLAI
jgi:6,7-dimethyl-8-ribityllumazine synthase